jgi:hypothetical protein
MAHDAPLRTNMASFGGGTAQKWGGKVVPKLTGRLI